VFGGEATNTNFMFFRLTQLRLETMTYFSHNQLLYICSTNNESNIHKQNGGKNKIDSYDEHVHTIQFQLYDKELF
jgi:hypothetical protein